MGLHPREGSSDLGMTIENGARSMCAVEPPTDAVQGREYTCGRSMYIGWTRVVGRAPSDIQLARELIKTSSTKPPKTGKLRRNFS